MSVVKATNVYKVFGKRQNEVVKRLEEGADRDDLTKLGTAAVIDASFDVQEGEIFVVMGLSGSGKSTLIRTLNGLWAPTSGSVEVLGTDIAKVDATALRKVRSEHISMVFQHFALLPHRTVRDNAAYALEIRGIAKAERDKAADRWLKAVGLEGWGDKYPEQLSGGMQQRVGLARALAAETDILLMDEAFSALDPLIRREMQEQLVELQGELKKTIIFITHDLNEAMFLGDRIAVMRNGRIVQVGTPEDILTDPANDYVAQFVHDVDRARVLTANNVMEKARQTVSSHNGPRVALRTMREHNASGVYVTDRDRKFLGLVSDRDCLEHIRRGATSLDEIIKPVSHPASQDDLLIDLFLPSSEMPLPVPVTDADGDLVGVVPRATLLAALGNQNGNDEQPTDASVDDWPEPVDTGIIDQVLAEADDSVSPQNAGERSER
ncbi:quaternary amine ABC transporter ATP-binding protein [Brevibacterium aurantiacum]|uniref:Glycine betaine ABC transporter ATP-binding protein n=1 Tax=Brevibacterium aurantiacum TaxID=273384 RepID=A0A2A3ZK90_BREAU|nr:glycine betaine/L-proline ABC transporter ATP-binding protein [Brevibacterium aurantiacum]PCC43040.1 glycine betaine ABC transporter ATP-binding protein [Brevibacterium aurantiacum]PCC51785.1 glycine betaine ABC transporter ATP-binding protein [Brevibacterium aurantiacum]